MSEALGLTEWSICCHPDFVPKLPLHRAVIEADIIQMRGLTGEPAEDAKLPVIGSELIPYGQVIIAGPTDPAEDDAAWNAVYPMLDSR